MGLDRESIEKRDFPVARRGYNPEAVDAHLRSLAAEVEQLRRAAERARDSLADTAGEQVRSILEAAQSTAAKMRAEAEEEARRVRAEARDDAKASRANAAAQAAEHVSGVSKSTASMRERIEVVDRELSGMFDSLRATAGRLSAHLSELEAELEEAAAAGPRSRGETVATSREAAATAAIEWESPARREPSASREPEAAPAPDEPETAAAEAELAAVTSQPEPEPEPARPARPKQSSRAPAGAGNADDEGARLIALNMALNGSPREEVDRYLSENYELAEQEALLDEVFASVEG